MFVKMNSENATEIIIKYLNDRANSEEIDRLFVWLEEPEHQIIFDELVKVNIASTSAMHSFDKIKVKMQLLSRINHQEKSKSVFNFPNFLKIAAVLIIALGTWFVFQNDSSPVLSDDILQPASEAITLEMEDGSVQILNLSTSTSIKNADGKIVGSSSKDG